MRSDRLKGDCNTPWYVVLAIVLGAFVGVPLLVGLCIGIDRCVNKYHASRRAKKEDVEARRRNSVTRDGEVGAKDSFETIELQKVGVEGPP